MSGRVGTDDDLRGIDNNPSPHFECLLGKIVTKREINKMYKERSFPNSFE